MMTSKQDIGQKITGTMYGYYNKVFLLYLENQLKILTEYLLVVSQILPPELNSQSEEIVRPEKVRHTHVNS